MAWTVPLTAVSNATLTAAQWNATVRDNLLETGPAKATASGRFFATTGSNSIAERIPSGGTVSAGETTASTSYTNLATSGPALTLATSTAALVAIGAHVTNDTVGANAFASYAVSGATSVSAVDNWAVGHATSGGGRVVSASRVQFQSSLTAGNNTFTMQYRVAGGTGTFSNRHIAVIPF